MSAAGAVRGSVFGTLMLATLSKGFAGIRSWRTAHRQNAGTILTDTPS